MPAGVGKNLVAGAVELQHLAGSAKPGFLASGATHHVKSGGGRDGQDGISWETAFATIAKALTEAAAGDRILIAEGEYDEEISITKDNITLIGVGARGAVAIAPSGANGKAIKIGSGSATRVKEVTLMNIGGEGAGTGGGLHIEGNIRRLRFVACKLEGGTFGAKLESTANGSVGDVIFDDCEFAWTKQGIHITASGGGDPVTNVQVLAPTLFHNCEENWILSDVAHTTNLQVRGCTFDLEEDASVAANNQLKVNVASSQGIFAGNSFALATMAAAKLAIASGILWVGNMTEAGVGGRPA